MNASDLDKLTRPISANVAEQDRIDRRAQKLLREQKLADAGISPDFLKLRAFYKNTFRNGHSDESFKTWIDIQCERLNESEIIAE